MEKFFEDENTCDIFMNEVRMEDEHFLEPQENVNLQENESLQIEKNRNLGINEKKMKKNFKQFHAQRSFWKRNSRNALCWAFYCVNANKEVNVTTFQTVHCILCHNNPILNVIQKRNLGKE